MDEPCLSLNVSALLLIWVPFYVLVCKQNGNAKKLKLYEHKLIVI